MAGITLHPVQIAALDRSGDALGFAYFMEQGLGKTLTAQVDFLNKVAAGRANRSVVICPNSFKSGWVDEARKWGLKIEQYVWTAGSERECRKWFETPSTIPKQIIVNYEAIRSEKVHDMLLDYMRDRHIFMIFDESIQVKNNKAKQSKMAIELSKHAIYSRILSGKPMSQGPHDLWAQMRCIGQLEGRNYYAFKTAFCRMGGWQAKQVIGAQNEDILASIIEPHVFRATKADWTGLPPKSYTTREYQLTGELQVAFSQMYNEFVVWLSETDYVTVDQAITKYIKLAQIQCGWIYKNPDEDEKIEIEQLVPDDKNPRLQLLKQVLEEEVTGKAAIAYKHKPVFDQLLRNLGGEKNCAWIKGGMAPEEIAEQKRRFNEDPECRYILLQTVASKYGHTLLGIDQDEHRCYTMIMYENTYSLDDRSQIEDRIHRHGQKADAVLYIDLAGTSLDRDCIAALQRKENVFQSVFSKIRRS